MKPSEIGLTIIEKGKCIVGHYEIEHNDFEKSWKAFFIWMNENGFKKADGNPFEISPLARFWKACLFIVAFVMLFTDF